MCSLTRWQRTSKGKRSGSSPPGGRGCHFCGLAMNKVAVSPVACFDNWSLTFSSCFQKKKTLCTRLSINTAPNSLLTFLAVIYFRDFLRLSEKT